MRFMFLALAVLLGAAAPAWASDEAAIRGVIARWYSELAKKEDGRPWSLTSPGFIEAAPHYRYIDNGAAALVGPPLYTSLAARALQFAYDVVALRVDPSFARVDVWERGYFYASLPARTYELAAYATFVLEKQPGGEWLILAHDADSVGIPPNRITDPMPDLRDLFLQTRQGSEERP